MDEKSKLIHFLGEKSKTPSNELLIELMEYFNSSNLKEININQIKEFISFKNLK